MVVLLSALLVSLPNLRLFENKQMPTEGEQVSIRRSLLSDLQATEDDLNMEEFLIFKDDEPEFDSKLIDDDNSTGKEFAKILNNLGKFNYCYHVGVVTFRLLFQVRSMKIIKSTRTASINSVCSVKLCKL